MFDALKQLGSNLMPLIEGTVAMSDIDAPEPDSVLITAPQGSGLIPLASVELAIEVADSSMPFDVGRKAELYARHRIPEYWVVGLPTATIEQMWLPAGGIYTERRELKIGERIESLTIPGLAVESAGLI